MNKPSHFDNIITNVKAKNKLAAAFELQDSRSRILITGPKGTGKHFMIDLFLEHINLSKLSINVNDYQFDVDQLIDVVAPLKQNTVKDVRNGKIICVVVDGFEQGMQYDKCIYDAISLHMLEGITLAPVIVICDNEAVKQHMPLIKYDSFTKIELQYLTPLEKDIYIQKVLNKHHKGAALIHRKSDIESIIAKSNGTFDDCLAKATEYIAMKKNKKGTPVAPVTTTTEAPTKERKVKKTLDYMEQQADLASDRDVYPYLLDDEDMPIKTPEHLARANEVVIGLQSMSKLARSYSKESLWLDLIKGFFLSEGLISMMETTVYAKKSPIMWFEGALAKFGLSADNKNLHIVDTRLHDSFEKRRKHCKVVKDVDTGDYFRRNEPDCDDGYKGDLYKPTRDHKDAKALFVKPNLIDINKKKRKKMDNQLTLDMLLVKKQK